MLRELIHLLTVPKVMIVLDQKLSDGLIIAQNNANNAVALLNLHGILTVLEQVTRVVQINEIDYLAKTM